MENERLENFIKELGTKLEVTAKSTAATQLSQDLNPIFNGLARLADNVPLERDGGYFWKQIVTSINNCLDKDYVLDAELIPAEDAPRCEQLRKVVFALRQLFEQELNEVYLSAEVDKIVQRFTADVVQTAAQPLNPPTNADRTDGSESSQLAQG